MNDIANDILFVVATHGDEPIGPALIDRLSVGDKTRFSSVISNPLALSQRRRFVETDLNRIAPGKKDSIVYEERRAAELVELFSDYKFIIDVHETKANDRTLCIIPRLTRDTLALAASFSTSDILIWPGTTTTSTGPLVRFAPCGIELECGTMTSFQASLDRLVSVVENFLETRLALVQLEDALSTKSIFLVGERIAPQEVGGVNLQDFVPVRTTDETYTPLLFGRHQGLIGYKMRRLDISEVLAKL